MPAPSGTAPLLPQPLEGARERLYWESLPEAKKRAALKNAGGGEVAISSIGKKWQRGQQLKEIERREIEQAKSQKRSVFDTPEVLLKDERPRKKPNIKN
jgi:hypothetical protein